MDREIDINWHVKEKQGWYKFELERVDMHGLVPWVDKYSAMVEWIVNQVEMPRRHARWIIHPEHAVFTFRHQRDYILFLLRWS